jgi:hypothetical protein
VIAAPVAGGATPWWAVPAGVIAGALITGLFGCLVYWRKRPDERRESHRTAAREVSVQLLREVNRLVNSVLNGTPYKADADDALYLAWAELPLVTTAKVAEAATDLIGAYQRFGLMFKQETYDAAYQQRLATFHAARRRYIDAVREDMGLPPFDGEPFGDDEVGEG